MIKYEYIVTPGDIDRYRLDVYKIAKLAFSIEGNDEIKTHIGGRSFTFLWSAKKLAKTLIRVYETKNTVVKQGEIVLDKE